MIVQDGLVNIYDDEGIISDFSEYLQLSEAVSKSEEQGAALYTEHHEKLEAFEKAFIKTLVTKIYQSLQMVSQEQLPALHIHLPGENTEMRVNRFANTVLADREGVHIGVNFVEEFEIAVFVLTQYLLDNFYLQIAPPMGDVPPINRVVTVEDFPAEALSLYSAHLIPEAESRDGYSKRPFQILMEFVQAATFHEHNDEGVQPLSRFMPKPPLDFVHFSQTFEADRIAENYLHPVNGPYLQELHRQLLLDGLFFILAHEVAHFKMGHFDHKIRDLAGLRAYEAEADMAALTLLNDIPGFELRSLSILFNFAGFHESDAPADMLDHPLARNRLMILYETILKQPGNEALYADINAGLHLVQTRLEPYGLLFGWPDQDPEEIDIFMSHYSDMSYTAHLFVYVEREPRDVEIQDAWKENAFVFAHLVFEISFALRDRVQPDIVYERGKAVYHPKIKGDGLFISVRDPRVYTRLHIPVPAPPEWFLGRPDSELVIERIELSTKEAIMPDDETEEPPIYFYYEPPEFDLDVFLRSMLTKSGQEEMVPVLLIAARRYVHYQRHEEAVALYQWLYERNPGSLTYADLIDFCASLMSIERYDQAEVIAGLAVKESKALRPGFHFVLAIIKGLKGEIQQAFEHTFLEMFSVGVYGEYFEKSQAVAADLLWHPQDPVMAFYRDFVQYKKQAEQAFEIDDVDEALSALQSAYAAIIKAKEVAEKDYLFLNQIEAEVMSEIYPLKWAEQNQAQLEKIKTKFLRVLEIDPLFAPAHIQLAKIALMEGNRAKAKDIWDVANEIAPFNKFVFDFRELVEDPNPDFHLTSWSFDEEG